MAGVLHIGHAHAYGAAKNAAGKGDSIVIGFHICQTVCLDNKVVYGALNLRNKGSCIARKTVYGYRTGNTCTSQGTGSGGQAGLAKINAGIAQSIHINIVRVQSSATIGLA